MKHVIVVHGYTSLPTKKKYRILARELKKSGIPYAIPALPGGAYPKSERWISCIQKEVESAKKPVVLVGHSLGARAVLLYLERSQRKVDTVILVAPLSNDVEQNRKRRGGKYASFFARPIRMEQVKKLARTIIVVHSKDDTIVPFEQGVQTSQDLDAKLLTYDRMGHFSGEKRAEQNARVFASLVRSVIAKTVLRQFRISQKAIILNRAGKFLIVKRTSTAPASPNTWDLPGGDLDFGESPKKGMIREIKEETGLEVKRVRPFDVEAHFNEIEEYWMTIGYTAYAVSEHVKLSFEHNEYRWVNTKEFLKLSSRKKLHQFAKNIPGYK